MTNESDFFAQADLGKALRSTYERKIMSTKTLRKRIALVAVAALGFGVITGVSANAAVDYFGSAGGGVTGGTGSVTVSGADSQNASTSAVVNKYVSIEFNFIGTSTKYSLTSSGAGSLFGTITLNGVTFEGSNGLNTVAGNGLISGATGGADSVSFKATSSAVGTQVITFTPQDGASDTSTLTINWVAAATAEVSADSTVMYASKNGTACTYGTGDAVTRTQALAAQTTQAVVSSPASTNLNICIIPFDASGNNVALFSYTLFSNLGGSQAGATKVNAVKAAITPATGTTGSANITAVISAGTTTITKTIAVSIYGTAKTLALGNVTYAAAYGGLPRNNALVYDSVADGTANAAGTKAEIGNASSSDGGLVLMAKDSTGQLVDLSGATNTIAWTIDSDKVAGTPSAGSTDAFAALTFDGTVTETADLKSTHLGGNGVAIRCDAANPEKLTITANGYDSAGAAIKSNSVDFYCSGSADKVEVKATATTANVMVTDKRGYPVPDGTAVTLAASNGSVVAPSSKVTAGGAFDTAAVFIPSTTAASSAVTAIVGSKTGVSAPVVGSTPASATADAQAKTDAAIASLIAKINSLTKLIAKIQKKLGVK